MNKTGIYKSIFSLFLLATGFWAVAQPKTIVKASVDRSQILIGEPILLKLEVDVPNNESIRFFTIDSIPHFEFLRPSKTDTINTSTGTKMIRVMAITSFDSGRWIIPAYKLTEQLMTDTIGVDVGYTPYDPNQDYHDIKDILDVDPEKKEEWWWYIAGGALLLLLLFIYLFRKKKPALISKPAIVVNAYDEAIHALTQLEKNRPEAKQFYSSLVNIFRLYVFRKKEILSLQKTTDDLVIQLAVLNLTPEKFEKLSHSLRLSDFVKFAKYIPSEEDDKQSLSAIKNAIMTIEDNEIKTIPGKKP